MTVTILLWVLAVLLIVAGLAGLVLPALPGPPLVLAGLLAAAWAEDFVHVGPGWLAVLAGLAGLAMLVDFAAGLFGAHRYGASPRALLGAALGAVIGMFFGLAGVLLGPFVGAVLGELSARRGLPAAARSGWGTTVGLLLGTAAKLALGVTMIGLFAVVRLF